MLKDEHEKYRICSRLLAGEEPKHIAASYENESESISYSTILRYKRELETAQQNNTVAEFLNIEEAMLMEMAELIKANADPSLKDAIKDATGTLVKSSNALELLNNDLILTAAVITKKIRAEALSSNHVSELESLTEALCKLQNAFFNKSTTQVNVQNNYDSTGNHRYSNWLSDSPAEQS